MPLSVLAVKNAKPRDCAFKMYDELGLYLQITHTGAKLWRYATKERLLAFGAFPDVSLAQARGRRVAARSVLASGRDPAAPGPIADSFETVARRWLGAKASALNARTVADTLTRLERNVFPAIGARPITSLGEGDMLPVFRIVADRGAIYLARRLRGYCAEVFLFAKAEGQGNGNPCADVGRALPSRKRVEHRRRITPSELAALLRTIDDYVGVTPRLALQFTMLTMARTGETRFATWAEIDGDTWRIPALRMKMQRDHVVPLSTQAQAILERVRALRLRGAYVFSGERGPMSENTMLYALYRMGYHSRQTVYGFRGLASTILNGANFNRDWIERQLAHEDDDEVRAAYNTAQWLPERRTMLQWWADHIDRELELHRLLG